MHIPVTIQSPNQFGGTQKLYSFPNGYGASVIRNSMSYGGKEGLWELAVLKGTDVSVAPITYDTPITEDVMGWLSDEEVEETLTAISALPDAI